MKLIPKHRLTPNYVEMDSLKRNSDNPYKKNIGIILQAQRCWDRLFPFRKDRLRNKNYTQSKQWSDEIVIDGKRITEEQYISDQGGIPLQNNLIGKMVRTVQGVYIAQNKEPTCKAIDREEQQMGEVMTTLLKTNRATNKAKELEGRLFREFLVGGAVFEKETFGFRNDRMDCWTDAPNPNYMFFDDGMSDFRHWDLSMIGEIHDKTFEQLALAFAENEEDFRKLKDIYTFAYDRANLQAYYDKSDREYRIKNLDFLVPSDSSKCRVIEIWNKEQKPRYMVHDYLNGSYYKIELDEIAEIEEENKRRTQQGLEQGLEEDDIPLMETSWFMDEYWYYRFLSPLGDIIKEGETPYKHKSHPYTLKLYPFIDGDIHSFISDVIDQQRYVNRLITLNDFVIRSSAKGVLLVPADCIPEDSSPEDFADSWARFDGTIVYKPSPSRDVPKQVSSNSTNIGINEMLQLQLNLMDDVSGISGALQGKKGFSGDSAALYAQQQQNSTSSLLDVLEAFSSFIKENSLKKLKNIQQFYDKKRILNVAGRKITGDLITDPEKINDIEFDLSIVESVETPTARMVANDFLMEMWKAKEINVEQLLEVGSFPFADTLLQTIRSQREQVNNGEIPNTMPPDMAQQVNANPQAVQQAQQMLK